MQLSIRPLDIVSRVVAVLLVGLLLAWLVKQFGAWETEAVAKMSHQELLDHVRAGSDPSFLTNYGRLPLVTFVYVALVEGVALVCRLIVRAVRPEKPLTDEAAKGFEQRRFSS